VSRTTALAVAGWLAAAALAVAVGLGVVQLIGAGLTLTVSQPRSAAEVERAAPPVAASAGLGPPSVAPTDVAPSGAGEGKVIRTDGGTVTARCVGSRVQLSAITPASGYRVHDRPGSEPADEAEVSFRGNRRYDVRASCPGGRLQPDIRERDN